MNKTVHNVQTGYGQQRKAQRAQLKVMAQIAGYGLVHITKMSFRQLKKASTGVTT